MHIARKIELTLYGLLLVGLVFIYNSSIVHSQNVFGNPHRFFILHLGWLLISLIVYKIFSKVDFKIWLSMSPVFYLVTGLFLAFLAFWGILPCEMDIPFAPCINNANRWIVLNPVPLVKLPFLGELSFQPSELAKLVLILFLAYKFSDKKNLKFAGSQFRSFYTYLLYAGIYTLLIFMQPNMSTGVLLFAIGTFMYVVSGESLKPFYYMVPLLLVLFVFMILGSSYRRQRLLTYINHTQTNSSIEEGYQVKQVKIALGSGGFFGVGFGNSRQKYTYLPEVSTDSIFAIIGEELGFVGTSVILGAFVFMIYCGIQVAKNSKSLPEKMCSVGIVSWLGIQILIHMAANSGLIPYTGVTLPFISYGGSSLVFTMMAMGILNNIASSKS